LSPPEKQFPVAFTEPIPLQVRPPEVVAVPVEAPESAYELATGPALLARQTAWRPPGLAGCLVLLLAPPLACAAWYLGSPPPPPPLRRAARAARGPVRALRAAEGRPPDERAARAARAVAGSLHARLDLATAEPTPAETADCLRRRGCPPELTERAARFFRA